MSLGFQGYADTSRLYNDELARYMNLKAQAEVIKKQADIEAGEKADLDTLRSLGEEFGMKQGKDLLQKYGTKMYNARVPYNDFSIRDLDVKAGEKAGQLFEKGKEAGASILDEAFSAGKNIPPPLSYKTPKERNLVNRMNDGKADEFFEGKGFGKIDEIPELNQGNEFAQFMNKNSNAFEPPSVPRVDDGSGLGLGKEVELQPMGKSDITPIEQLQDYKPLSGGGNEVPEIVKEPKSGAEEVGEALGKSASAVEDAGAEAVGEGVAQVAGVALDSTGILAPIGAAIGIGADLFALFEAGKTTADFVGRDILHTTPVPTSDIKMPNMPKTIAERGYMITPSIDTYDVSHKSYSQGW
jgi:hypothetical protein